MDTEHQPEYEGSPAPRLGDVKQVKIILSPEAEEVFISLKREAANSKVESSIFAQYRKKWS